MGSPQTVVEVIVAGADDSPLPPGGAGEVLVRSVYLSLDPYMRGRMNEGDSYARPVAIGEVMTGAAVGLVMASSDPSFRAGEVVEGRAGKGGGVPGFRCGQSGGASDPASQGGDVGGFDDGERRRLLEHHDRVDRRHPGQHLGPRRFRVHRPTGSLEFPDRVVRVQRDDLQRDIAALERLARGEDVAALKAACEAFGTKTQALADTAIGAAIKAQLNRESAEPRT